MFRRFLKFMKFLYCLPVSIYFNFRILPWGQAIKLPMLLYKPHFQRIKRGGIVIEAERISLGMVRLGFRNVGIYPNSGVYIENRGKLVFKGRCNIGNGSFISTGPDGKIVFGAGFNATCALKVVSYNRIEFGKNVLVGWENLFSDNDFHRMVQPDGNLTNPIGEIKIGDNNWFAMKCITLKGAKTGSYISVGACSLLNRDFGNESRCFICGSPAELRKTGYYFDKELDMRMD